MSKSHISRGLWLTLIAPLYLISSMAFARELSISDAYQEQEYWCWAASANVILDYYGINSGQCSIANYAFDQANCCNNVVWPNGTGGECNQGNPLNNQPPNNPRGIKAILSHFGDIESMFYGFPLGLDQSKSEIENEKPFIIQWDWQFLWFPTKSAHALVVYGLSEDNIVSIFDPWPGHGRQKWEYDDVLETSSHEWVCTLTSTHPTDINPTIAQTPMSGPPGSTFVQSGTGFTPSKTATIHVRKPDLSEYAPASQPLDSAGHFEIRYTSALDKALGTYTWWAIDDQTGKKSNEVSYQIVIGSGSLHGRLHENSATGPALSGATVSCSGKSTTTASSGTFSLSGIPAGIQTVVYSKSGYVTYERSATIVAGQDTDVGDRWLVKSPNDPPAPSGPDLAVNELFISKANKDDWHHSLTLEPGERFDVKVRIRNRGQTAATKAFTIKYMLSDDSEINSSDSVIGTDDVGEDVGPGSIYTDRKQDRTAPKAPGVYYIGASVDSPEDFNKTNNFSRGDDERGKLKVEIPPPVNSKPAGWLDSVSCEDFSGWTRDPDTTAPIQVHFYADGPAGTGKFVGSMLADLNRPDLPFSDKNHGFVFAVPGSLKDGLSHTIYAYGIDIPGGENPVLSGCPKTITCSLPSGSLNVTISPVAAVNAGAQWKVDGGEWRNNGITISGLTVGEHSVSFKPVTGWIAPTTRTVSISDRLTTVTNGTYTLPTGQLSVNLIPSEAVSAGAQWKIAGDAIWRNSGTAMSGVPIGSVTVEAKDLPGWSKPISQTVNISAGQTTSVTLTYALPPPLPPTVSLSANPNSVDYGGFSTLSWTATNASSCAASGGWNGTKAAGGGSEDVGPLTNSKTFSIECRNSAGVSSGMSSVTVTVNSSLPTISVAIADAEAAKPANYATFIINRSGELSKPVTIRYTTGGTAVNGSDYSKLKGSIKFRPGQTSATITVKPQKKAVFSGDKTVMLAITPDQTYSVEAASEAIVTILSDPVVSIEASRPNASESTGTTGQFTVTRKARDISQSLKLMVGVGGTAKGGSDYDPKIPKSIEIPANQSSVTLDIVPILDTLAEGEETVTVALKADRRGNYALGSLSSATVTIFEGAVPSIPGDLNKDGTVNALDFSILSENYGSTDCGNIADINGDCVVNIFDYNILQENYGRTI